MKPDNPQAFPQPRYLDYNGREPGTYKGGHDGMTLRDYFASDIKYNSKNHFGLTMKAKEKIMGKPCPSDEIESALWWMEFEAKIRYLKADLMLQERMKNQ